MSKNVFGVVVGLLLTGLLGAAESPLEVRILDYPDRLPMGIGRQVVDTRGLMEGWLKIEMRVEVTHIGQEELCVIPGEFEGYWGSGFSVWARIRDNEGRLVEPCWAPAAADIIYTGVGQLEPGWTEVYNIPICLPGVGRYTVEAVAGQSRESIKVISGETYDLWTGTSSSSEVSIEVTEPEGIDREVFEAFGSDALSEHWGDILRRFPTSTYAGYVIWHSFARGISSDQNSVAILSKDLRTSIESQSNSVPCDIPAWCDENGWMSMQGEIFVRWKVKWFERVLKYHSEIWFADEIRLKLALDRYRLGERTSVTSDLESLADHGRPCVAEKARALLEAMQAKGMLPGGEKDLATPQTESPETGSAGQ